MRTTSAAGQLRRLWSAEGAALAAGLVQGLVVARALGPDLYGVYALALTFTGFVFLVLDPRANDAVTRYLAEFRASSETDKARAVVRGGLLVDVLWGLGGLLLVSALAYPASLVLHISGHAALIPIVALGLAVVAPAATGRAVLGVFDEFDAISGRQFCVALLRALSVCAVALGGLGLTGVVWTLTLVSVVECALFVSAATRATRSHLGAGVRGVSLAELRGHGREMTHFITYSGLTTLASSAIKQVDTLLLGALAGPREAGYYRLAKSLTAPAANVGTPLQTVLYPRLASASSRGDQAGMRSLVRTTFQRVEVPLAMVSLVSLVLVPFAVKTLAGSSFEGAIGPTMALVVGVAATFATLHQRPVFLVRRQVRSLLWFTTITAALSVVAFVPGAQIWGADGVAWARTLVLILGSSAMALYLRGTSKDRDSVRRPAGSR